MVLKSCVIVEDDHDQASWIKERMAEAFSELEVRIFNTEYEFQIRLPEFEAFPPGIFIFDVMVRWTIPSPDMIPPPSNVKLEGRWRAGLRCERLVAASPPLRGVPVILYTILGANDLHRELAFAKGNFVHLQKNANEEPLLAAVERITGWQRLEGVGNG